MNELIIYGGVSFAFAAGWAFRAYTMPPLCVFDWRTVAGENHRKFVDACKQCNTIEGELDEALASNRRLTDALQAKNERLERIVAAFADQRSGTAKKAVKLALGGA